MGDAASYDQCIHSLLGVQAEDIPGSIAIISPGRAPLTYARLFTHIREVARTLNLLGVGRNDRVAIVLPNGPEMATAFLAVAAGATSAPLNPGYRSSEYEFYLSDLNAKILIVQSGMDSPARAVASGLGIPVIELSPVLEAEAGVFKLDCYSAQLTGSSRLETLPERAEGFAQPDDVALVLHTSGTTSRPKIVPLTHINLCTSARNIRSTLKLTEKDRCLNVMPLFHIHGLMAAVLASITAGSSVVCTPGFYAPGFFEWMKEFRPTWYTAVPTMHQAILARAADNREITHRCPLRFIRSSSSSLPPQVMKELEDTFSAPVVESYGMTEASHQMASNPLPPGERKAGSVGTAAGPEVAIMDEAGKLLPLGETGEIVIRGANVTLGYENNPEANEKAFTNGWFRTGDQGYMDDDSYVCISGRLKEIINRGGEKIAPREVDEALMDHPDIVQVVAFALPHKQLGEEVAAAVILRENASVTEREIQEFASKKLADFKVPRQVVILDEIPKGPTGKLQRIGLAEKLGLTMLDQMESAAKTEFVTPRNPVEKKLVEIWSQVLQIEKVGIHDNFIQLGGDSILAAQILSRIPKTMREQKLPLVTFLYAPTVEEMANVLSQGKWSPPQASLVAIQSEGSKPPFFGIHGCRGEALLYRSLARHLGSEQPLYALRAQGLDGERVPYTRIEDIAGHYVREIRAIQPEGPYFLGGAGVGGMIAFEMAQQLLAQTQELGLLVLIDTAPPRQILSGSFTPRSRKSLYHYVRRSIYYLRHGQLTRILKGILQKYWKRSTRMFMPAHIRRVRNALDKAPWSYKPREYPHRIIYFLSEKRRQLFGDPQAAVGSWCELAIGGVDIRVISGNHLDMLKEPHVQILAEQLKDCLDEVPVKSSGVTRH